MIGLGAVTLMGLLGTASAQEAEVSANISLTSNYVFRGLTQTDDGPAIQGGFDVTSGGFYVGTWASSVDFGDDTTLEVDVYGGYSGALTETTSYDVGVIYYAYPDSPELPTGSQDFVEIYGGISQTLTDALSGGLYVYYSPEFYGETGEAVYVVANADYAVTEAFSIGATYGISEFHEDGNTEYQDYSVGAFYSCDCGLDFGLVFTDTVELDGDNEAVAFSVSKSM